MPLCPYAPMLLWSYEHMRFGGVEGGGGKYSDHSKTRVGCYFTYFAHLLYLLELCHMLIWSYGHMSIWGGGRGAGGWCSDHDKTRFGGL